MYLDAMEFLEEEREAWRPYEALLDLSDEQLERPVESAHGQTALMFASYYGHTELARLLLTNGADVNADFEGDTALTWAKQKGHAEIVNLLIASGATR